MSERGGSGMLVTIASLRDPWEAQFLRLRLEAEQIPAFVAFEFHIGNNWPWSTALGGVRVQVPTSCEAQAIEVERGCRDGRYRAELAEFFAGDLDDPRCPHCGSTDFRKRRPIGVIVFFVVALLAISAVPAWGWVCSCRKCGTRFSLH